MRDRPSGADLLALAADVAWGDDGNELVERCRAIDAREQRLGDAPWNDCVAALRAIYGAGDPDSLFDRLARDIGSGVYEAPGPARAAVRRLLWAITEQKLRESNPDFLARRLPV